MYWIVSNGCRKLYSAFPLFGTLRASLAIIHRDGKFLVIHRNDGRGVSLPEEFQTGKKTTIKRLIARSMKKQEWR
jgi:hypothetical protein